MALPFLVRTLIPAIRGLDPALGDVAASLGAGAARRWLSIDIPLLAGPLTAALSFAFAISLGEFGATLMVSRPDYPTLPTAIYRLINQPGALNYGQAMAMSVLLLLATGLGFVAIDRLDRR
jgi:thiamine transport system permease protein